MESEKLDILADKRMHNRKILAMIDNYCRRHRMLDVGLGSMSKNAMDAIGNEIVDLFVDRVGERNKETPPDTGAPGGANGDDIQARTRGRNSLD